MQKAATCTGVNSGAQPCVQTVGGNRGAVGTARPADGSWPENDQNVGETVFTARLPRLVHCLCPVPCHADPRPHPAPAPLLSSQILTNAGYLANPIGLNLIATGMGPGQGNLLAANGMAGTLVEIAPNTAVVPGLQVRPRQTALGWTVGD